MFYSFVSPLDAISVKSVALDGYSCVIDEDVDRVVFLFDDV